MSSSKNIKINMSSTTYLLKTALFQSAPEKGYTYFINLM
ncbi:predicted protein [Botrytis cinerea T4]|uniref:Uncharacterized protein n=1 Tax=Botryotinia fuckeliana (strain T4) TaxID=999810 RepID=G2YFA0_BOTF4|nr:predicted protein [Botrytis cinerea T4]